MPPQHIPVDLLEECYRLAPHLLWEVNPPDEYNIETVSAQVGIAHFEISDLSSEGDPSVAAYVGTVYLQPPSYTTTAVTMYSTDGQDLQNIITDMMGWLHASAVETIHALEGKLFEHAAWDVGEQNEWENAVPTSDAVFPPGAQPMSEKEARCLREARTCKHITLPWVPTLVELQLMPVTSNGIHICKNADGVYMAYIRLGEDYEYPIIVDVLFGHPTLRPSWYATQGPNKAWALFPSLHMPEVFHCTASLVGVPDPAPWLDDATNRWDTIINRGNVFLVKQLGHVNDKTITSF